MEKLIEYLEKKIKKKYTEDWDYWNETPNYEENLKNSVNAFVKILEKITNRKVYVNNPMNNIGYFILLGAFHKFKGNNRFDVKFLDKLKRRGTAIFLEIKTCAFIPVAEATWHIIWGNKDRSYDKNVYDLLDYKAVPLEKDLEEVVKSILDTAEEVGVTIVSKEITHLPTDPTLPPPIFEPPNPRIRDYLFGPYPD